MTSQDRLNYIKTDGQLAKNVKEIATLNSHLKSLEEAGKQLPSGNVVLASATMAANSAPSPEKNAAAQDGAQARLSEVATYGIVGSQQLAAAATILNGLGVNKGLTNRIGVGAKALAVASSLMQISNPLGFLPALAGGFSLLAPGQSDPQMEAILNQIADLRKDIAKLHQQIIENHQETLRHFGAVENALLELYFFQKDDQTAQLGACRHAIPKGWLLPGSEVPVPVKPIYSMKEGSDIPSPTLINAPELRPASYEAAHTLWKLVGGPAVICMGFLQQSFTLFIQDGLSRFRISSIVKLAEGQQITRGLQARLSNSEILESHFQDLSGIVARVSDNAKISWFEPPVTVADIDWQQQNSGLIRSALDLGVMRGQGQMDLMNTLVA